MPILAGWLTGEQVPQQTIQQTLETMGTVLGRHGGQQALALQPGAGLLAFSDTAYVMRQNSEPPVLDWVPQRRTFVYRRPLSGLHPLFFIEDWPAQGNLLFASEIKALLAVGAPRRLHLAALDALARYGFIPAPWTPFEQIKIVPAGSHLRWQHAKTVLSQGSDLRLCTGSSNSIDELEASLTTGVTDLLPPHDQLVFLLGEDRASTLVAALASPQAPSPMTLAALGFPQETALWQEGEQLAEQLQASLLAIAGVDQPEYWSAVIAALEAPCVSTLPLALHQLLHTSAAETQARVAFSSLGAGLLTGQQTTIDHPKSEPLAAYQRQHASETSNGKAAIPWSAAATQSLQKAEPWEATLHARRLARQASQLPDSWQRHYYLDLHLRLPDLQVFAAQQLATEEQLALRSPFLLPTIIKLLTGLPAPRAPKSPRATLLTNLQKRARLSPSNLDLPRTVPTRSLLQTSDSDFLHELLSPEALHQTGIFDPKDVLRLQQDQSSEHAPRALRLVFTTQLFCRIFQLGLP